MMSATLTLPIPVSSNRYWASRVATVNGRTMPLTYVTAEAKAYKRAVAWSAKGTGIREPIMGRVAVDIRLYPKRPLDWAKRAAKDPECWDDSVQCLDLDNINKVLLDALKDVVFQDDKMVRRLSSERMEPDGDGRVIVTVTKIVVARHQQSLIEEPA